MLVPFLFTLDENSNRRPISPIWRCTASACQSATSIAIRPSNLNADVPVQRAELAALCAQHVELHRLDGVFVDVEEGVVVPRRGGGRFPRGGAPLDEADDEGEDDEGDGDQPPASGSFEVLVE